MALEHSRAVRLAARASGRGESELERALEVARVVVTAEADLPGALLTTRVLLTTLRRLPGELVLEPDGLSNGIVDEIAAAVSAVDPERPLIVGKANAATVRLHVGTSRGDQALRLVPEAHGAHVAGQRSATIRPRREPSALGAIYTAALGAAEAFKYTAGVRPERRVAHRHLRFCPVTLSSDLATAPPLSATLELALTLAGVGAIGTGVVLILSELDVFGRLIAVDYECFERENRGTCSLGGAAEVAAKPPKVALAETALRRFDVLPFPYAVEELPAAIDHGRMPWLPLVVSGLDTPEARRATQRLWPDRVIDAATGDTMLGLHEYVHPNGPCMTCFFPVERAGLSAVERLAAATGLSVELLSRGDEILREKHLVAMSNEQHERPAPSVPACGLARALGLTDPTPTATSRRCRSSSCGAALAVGVSPHELGPRQLLNLVQYDGLSARKRPR